MTPCCHTFTRNPLKFSFLLSCLKHLATFHTVGLKWHVALCIFSFRGLFWFFVFPEILVLSALWGRILPSQTNCLRFQHRLETDQLWATRSHGTFKVSSYRTGAKFKQITVVVWLLQWEQAAGTHTISAIWSFSCTVVITLIMSTRDGDSTVELWKHQESSTCQQSQRLFLRKRRAGTVCCFFFLMSWFAS